MRIDALTHASMDRPREGRFREGAVTGVRRPCPRGLDRQGSAFLSRSLFHAGNGASRTCVAVAPRSLLVSRDKVYGQPSLPHGNAMRRKKTRSISGGWRRGECTCRVNGILIMFPLACSIRAGGRFGRRCDGRAGFSQGWGLIAGPQTPMRQAESTGAKE
jgi:hypothetical protein